MPRILQMFRSCLALAALAFVLSPVTPATAEENNPDYRRMNFDLFEASKEGRTDAVKALLAQGASVKARNRFGNTALIYAARSGNVETVKALLEADSDLNHQNLNGSSVLFDATKRNKEEVAPMVWGGSSRTPPSSVMAAMAPAMASRRDAM